MYVARKELKIDNVEVKIIAFVRKELKIDISPDTSLNVQVSVKHA